MSFQTQIEIRGYHCDAYGHVNNARYLELFEEARWRSLEDSKVLAEVERLKYLFYIVHLEMSFKKAVDVLSKITIVTAVHEISRRVITFRQHIENEQNEMCTEANVKFVLFDQESGRAAPINDEIRNWFNDF